MVDKKIEFLQNSLKEQQKIFHEILDVKQVISTLEINQRIQEKKFMSNLFDYIPKFYGCYKKDYEEMFFISEEETFDFLNEHPDFKTTIYEKGSDISRIKPFMLIQALVISFEKQEDKC